MPFRTAWQIGLFALIGGALCVLPMVGIAGVAGYIAGHLVDFLSTDLGGFVERWTRNGLVVLLAPYAVGMVVRSLAKTSPDLRDVVASRD